MNATSPARGDLRLFGDATRRTADVKSSQRELSAWFTNALCCYDPNGLAHIDLAASTHVASIALDAHAALGLACEHRANEHFFNTGLGNAIGVFFFQQSTRVGHHILVGIESVILQYATNDAVGQRLDYLLSVLESADLQPLASHAVFFADHHILSHIDHPPRQISGFGRLQSRIGQTLARSVGRDEVLEHRQPFFERGDNWCFDDFADGTGQLFLRLVHQTAHAA